MKLMIILEEYNCVVQITAVICPVHCARTSMDLGSGPTSGEIIFVRIVNLLCLLGD